MERLIIILGVTSYLGSNLYQHLKKHLDTFDVYGTSRRNDSYLDLDLKDPKSVDNFLDEIILLLEKNDYEELVLINTISEYKRMSFSEHLASRNSISNDVTENYFSLVEKVINNISIRQHFISVSTNLLSRYNPNNFRYIFDKCKINNILLQLAYNSKIQNQNFRCNIVSPGFFNDMEKKSEKKDYSILHDTCLLIQYLCLTKELNGQNILVDRGDVLGY